MASFTTDALKGQLPAGVTDEMVQDAMVTSDFTAAMKRVTSLDEQDADPTKPYEHRYTARRILQKIQVLATVARQTSMKDGALAPAQRAEVDLRLGRNFLETEELHEAGKPLSSCVKVLDEAWFARYGGAMVDGDDDEGGGGVGGEGKSVEIVEGADDDDAEGTVADGSNTPASAVAPKAKSPVNGKCSVSELTAPVLSVAENACALAIDAYNHLGILWSGRVGRAACARALRFLHRAEALYFAAVKEKRRRKKNSGIGRDKQPAPGAQRQQGGSLSQYGGTGDDKLEKLYTNTAFYLAQGYGRDEAGGIAHQFAVAGEHGDGGGEGGEGGNAEADAELDSARGRSGQYCHLTMQRHMASGSYDSLDWARNALHLSKYYLGLVGDVAMGLHCVACGRWVAQGLLPGNDLGALWPELQKRIPEGGDFNRVEAARELCAQFDFEEGLLHAQALRETRDTLLRRQFGEPDPPEVAARVAARAQAGAVPEGLKFSPLWCGIPAAQRGEALPATAHDIVGGIDATQATRKQHAAMYARATGAFKRALGFFTRALRMWALDGWVSEHVKVAQEVSRLYRYLGALEVDNKRRLAMHARRVALLEPIVREISPQHFDVFHKELAYELGECCAEMADAKGKRLEAKAHAAAKRGAVPDAAAFRAKPAEYRKLNSYCDGGIRHFRHYLAMYRALPGQHDDDKDGQAALAEDPLAGGAVAIYKNLEPDNLTRLPRARDFPVRDGGDLGLQEGAIMALFQVARLQGKKESAAKPYAMKDTVAFLMLSLQGYRDVLRFAKELEAAAGGAHAGGGPGPCPEQLRMAGEMVELLPSKIDRMHYGGKKLS